MFSATFLGHHAWLFSGERANVLVDPLLFDRFGHSDVVGFHIHPPRAVDFGAFPPVDAVFLTHEHEGHLDLRSLHALDRTIPIYMPRLSSSAMRRILEEMGFEIRLISPGEPIEVGDLVLLPLPSDQITDALIDEWDNLAYVVYDRGGDGSLFSNVDMPPTERMWRPVQQALPRPGLWALTNNFHDTYFQFNCYAPNREALGQFVSDVTAHSQMLATTWARPEALLLVGVGLSFGKGHPINRNAFTWTSDDAGEALSKAMPDQPVAVPFSGQTFEMRGGKLVNVRDAAPFAVAPPRAEWPSRKFEGDIKWLERYEPATGTTEFPSHDAPELRRELDGLAQHLYAGRIFRQLYSLSQSDLGGKKATFALALLTSERRSAYVLAYEPQGCRFVPVSSPDPFSEYLAVFECWATDMLAFLRSDISNACLVFGRSRTWNNAPSLFTFDLNHALFEYVNPLRMPERFLRFYRSYVRGLDAGEGSKIRARAGDATT